MGRVGQTRYIHRIWPYIWWFPCQSCRIYTVYIGLARTVYIHRIWPYIWWFPCQRCHIYTVYIWFWPILRIYIWSWSTLFIQYKAHVLQSNEEWVLVTQLHDATCKDLRQFYNSTVRSTHSRGTSSIQHVNSRALNSTGARNTHTHTHRHTHTHTHTHTE